MEEDSFNLINNNDTYYHPLCELKINELDKNQNHKILDREDIRILSYNIFLRPPPIKNNDNDWKDERLDDFIKQIYNYDIICLQEMFATFSSRKFKIIRAAAQAGFFFYVETESPSFFSTHLVDGGLLILSRYI